LIKQRNDRRHDGKNERPTMILKGKRERGEKVLVGGDITQPPKGRKVVSW